jgi:hypothetical protein
VTPKRPSLFAALVIAALVVLVAMGIFTVQSVMDGRSCESCGWFSPNLAFSALFASLAGLLVAIGLAMALGMNWRRDLSINTALARSIENEEEHLQDYRLRRAQLDEWTAMAATHAAEKVPLPRPPPRPKPPSSPRPAAGSRKSPKAKPTPKRPLRTSGAASWPST